MAGAYTLYVQLQAGLSGLTNGLRGGAQQLRAFDGQLGATRAALERVEAAAERLGRAQVSAAAEAARAQTTVREAVERTAAAETAAAAAGERAGRAQAVAASAAARAQAEQTAAVEATARALRAQELAATMAARAQQTTGAGALAAQRTAEAAAASAARAGEAQAAQAVRAAAAQETAARAARLAESTSASATAAAVAATQARTAQAATEEQAARRTATATAQVTAAEREAAAATQAANAARTASYAKSGLLIGAILAAGIAQSVALQREMANVLTISEQITPRNLGVYTEQIIAMSKELPQSARQLAEGLYQVVSTGFDGAQAMEILHVAAKGASAGLTTTEVSARALLGVLKAYGLPASQASDVMDVMFQIVNKGVVSFAELAQQLGDVVPMAAAAGVKFDDLGAALAGITLAGIPAAESATALNMLMTRLMRPTRELTDLMHDLGYESAASAVQQDGLYVVIQKVNAATKGSAEQTVQLFKDIRAVRAVLALAAADGKNYSDAYQAIAIATERAGATQKAYALQANTVAGQWDLARNRAAALGMDISRLLLPVLQELTADTSAVIGAIGDLPAPVKDLAGVLIALAAAGMLTRSALSVVSSQLTAFRAATAEAAAGGSVLPVILRGASLAVTGLSSVLALGVLGYAAYSASKQHAKQVTDDLAAALRREREEHEQGAGLRALAESLSGSDDLKKLQAAGLAFNEIVDGLVNGGDKLSQLKDRLDVGKLASWNKDLMAYDPSYDKAKEILDQRRKTWSDAVRKDAELADAMNIISAKVNNAVQTSAKAWNLDMLVPHGKNGEAQYTDQMKAMAKAIGDVVSPTTAWKDAQDKAASSTRAGALSVDLAKTSIGEYIDKLADQHKTTQQFQQDLQELRERGYGQLAEHFAQLGDASAGMASQLVENLRQGKAGAAEQLTGLVQVTKAKLDDYMAELRTQLQAQRDWQHNLSELALAGYSDLTAHFADLGQSAAPILDELVKQLKAGHTQVADELQSIVAESTARSQATYQAGLEQLPAIAAKYGADTARAWATAAETNDVAAFGKVLQQMAVADMANAVKMGTDASRQQMAIGLDLVTQVAGAKGLDSAQAFADALLAGDINRAMTTLATIWGADQPISPPDLSAVIAAFGTAGSQAKDQWSAMLQLIEQVSKERGQATAQALTKALLSGDMGAVQAELDKIGASVRAIPGQKTITVSVDAPSSVNIPIYLQQQSKNEKEMERLGREANGGVLSFYAQGGIRREEHVAQIAPAGAWRVWAEPETAGEAYIPLAAGKRARSRQILQEVAHRFGGQVVYGLAAGRQFADGGILTSTAAPPRTLAATQRVIKLVPAQPPGRTVVIVQSPEQARPLIGSMPITITGGGDRPEAFADAVMRRVRHLQRGGRA
ncbi:phage tail tape measure protein [Kitasatospora acidiphila]|uniref:Phage tail tape measure protein n=1 Tax=Kitasatospora acidiphila TaxID=2567942 RepID=A0A540W9G9_9ACTN|nr:phage tail tape measure protein [Kitasatospora acidiphila]TQF05567.1 phage tail tape measure protein [Kitasatospora acidiphila]